MPITFYFWTMNNTKYTWILYVIISVIIGTIAIQVYWNYKNYLINKQQLINDVQQSLDDAVETYFTQLVQNQTLNLTFDRNYNDSIPTGSLDSLMHAIRFNSSGFFETDSIDVCIGERLALIELDNNDTVFKEYATLPVDSSKGFSKAIFQDILPDSTFLSSVNSLSSKVIVSMTTDSLRITEIDSIFKTKIKEKNININHTLKFRDFHENDHEIDISKTHSDTLKVISTSPFLHFDGRLSAHFNNPTKVILGRILSGILLSTILVLAVIACLIYLLNVIKRQKQIAEIKNDLISNITHEFKTPIATIGVALESLLDFKALDNKEKTTSYINMSKDQLDKLNIMVEKLLETASLDSETLVLNKEPVLISILIENLIEKHKITSLKTFTFKDELPKDYEIKVDVFHFENALSNIIDNAIKYGGNQITISIHRYNNTFAMTIADSGTSLTKTHKDKIFEKFYRVPSGNQHDIKGFGIGLYYAKRIIEKHNGSIELVLNDASTGFKITLPHE